jgi:hypothetical protein
MGMGGPGESDSNVIWRIADQTKEAIHGGLPKLGLLMTLYAPRIPFRGSRVRAHREGQDDGLVSIAPLICRCGGRFVDLLDAPVPIEAVSVLRAAETIGRPLGSASFSTAAPPGPAAIPAPGAAHHNRGPGLIRSGGRWSQGPLTRQQMRSRKLLAYSTARSP